MLDGVMRKASLRRCCGSWYESGHKVSVLNFQVINSYGNAEN